MEVQANFQLSENFPKIARQQLRKHCFVLSSSTTANILSLPENIAKVAEAKIHVNNNKESGGVYNRKIAVNLLN